MLRQIKDAARTVFRRPGIPATPVGFNALVVPDNQWYAPALAGASTFAEAMTSAATVKIAIDVLERLSPDAYAEYVLAFYRDGLAKFGGAWRYADINTALLALAAALRPSDYLEIGVRRGRSLAMVASAAPACRLVGCDLFIENYAGMENPGPEFVRAELARVGSGSALDLLVGDSKQVLAAWIAAHPDRFFDLITVDGDHSEAGARADLALVMPRLCVGGALVFDDLSNPAHPALPRVWAEVVGADPDFTTFSFTELGFGVGVAIRMR